MADFDFDAVVVGAGAVGLACGYALSKRGLVVAVLSGLEARGHKVTRTKSPSFDFGSSQLIWRFPEGGPYLGASGPSNPADFAACLGVGAGDADPWWSLVEEELTEVQVEAGGRRWLLTRDRDALSSPPHPTGVRLLPPRDPYTQLRDRSTIVDEQHHRAVWRAVGEPGALLVDGRVAGTWRARAKGRSTTLAVTTFGMLSARDDERLREEAAQVAGLRGSAAVEVTVDGG